MKTLSRGQALFAVLALSVSMLLATHVGTIAQNVACYMDQGGAGWHLGSGCTQTVESGGTLNVAAGGNFQIGGTTMRFARGTVTLDGSNPSSFAHGLTSVTVCQLTDVRSTAPGDEVGMLTYVVNGANIDVYAWMNTGGTDPTLVASTDANDVIAYFCVGT